MALRRRPPQLLCSFTRPSFRPCPSFALLSESQEKLQAKYNAIAEYGTTPSDEYAYHHYLFRVPTAVTINRDTKNRKWLEPGNHDWLGNDRNRVVVELKHMRRGKGGKKSGRRWQCFFCKSGARVGSS